MAVVTRLGLYGGPRNVLGLFGTPGYVADITGTIIGVTEAVVVSTGGTIILTLTNDTFIAAGTGPIGTTAQTQALIDGMTSSSGEAGGWNATVRDVLVPASDVVRTSDTVVTITVPATAGYDITATETITITIPAAILTENGSPLVGTGLFRINVVSAGGLTTGDIPQLIPSDIPKAIGNTIG